MGIGFSFLCVRAYGCKVGGSGLFEGLQVRGFRFRAQGRNSGF